MTAGWDVVVVGAGSSGCALAARLADAGRRVLLLEAGADHARPGDFPPDLRDAATLGATVPGHPANRSLSSELTPGSRAPLPRGRGVGGSSAVNGGYFVRATPADHAGWAAAGNDLWSLAASLPAWCRLEADRQYGDRPGHGGDGPLPVSRPTAGSPLTDALAAAAAELGVPEEPDKNAGGPPGWGPVPFTVRDGVRVNTAMAYLSPRRGAAGLTVRGGVDVRRVLVEGGRAVGVDTDAGPVRAAEVVLAAGAAGSPHLLLLSGVGPAAHLRAHGIDVVVDAPGVGAGLSDHPLVYLPWTPLAGLPEGDWPLPLHSVLNTTSEDSPVPGDLEVLPWLRPWARVVPGGGGDGTTLSLAAGLYREESRGRLALASADPAAAPRIAHGYLATAADRRRLREAVRLAAALLRTRALAPLVAHCGDPADDVLADDRALDAWVAGSLATAQHLAGSARMGPDGDPGAVVDQHLRVRGVAGLRVADLSVLPEVPTRGPAATAVLVGERAAELMTGG
ncbi:putative dehydrogenase (TIGR03970 family) [Geodermatophilus bullaregiensis]|uniref:mycofactocin dehydrogenase MftG n=1 Tax=Geodermatophilus bullaregiensis TaxID=1564160 RepID=UPI00195A5929|nr:mycofactocin system GMC family oxidoreductase MftG [Geodermatophilus bullaregiensis]MBM7806217.1 putative dehydrogenase (TIGR03970 family) [Geodermatophilus bullaregiensis]